MYASRHGRWLRRRLRFDGGGDAAADADDDADDVDDPDFQLKCIVSTVDGNKYCVRDRASIAEAADLLARVTQKLTTLVEKLGAAFPDDARVQRLVGNYNPAVIMETLPTSAHTAYSENKGEKIAFCLNEARGDSASPLIDEHTLTFVAIHELAHLSTESVGHKTEFWDNFKFLLEQAKAMGVHDPVNYKASPRNYCGMEIRDNPYYDQ